jgi:hypothetical protein
LAARNFINQTVALDDAGRVTSLENLPLVPRRFRRAAGRLVPFLLRYLEEGPARTALAMASPRLRWTTYRWTLEHEPVE